MPKIKMDTKTIQKRRKNAIGLILAESLRLSNKKSPPVRVR